jgi:hypothetical protein
MVKIKCIKKNFISNNETMNLIISYNEYTSSTAFQIEDINIKKAKVSCIIYGNCNINNVTYYFKSLTNFLIINNGSNIILSNISINQIYITDSSYNIISDVTNDDFIENLIYDFIKKIFKSSNINKQSDCDYRYNINFNINLIHNIDNYNIVFNELFTIFTIGVFNNNFLP